MNLPRSIRILIAMAVLVLGLAALLLVLTISEATLNIKAHLDASPVWLRYTWWALAATISLVITWIIWRLLAPTKKPADDAKHAPPAPDADSIEAAIARADELGIDTATARHELDELARRRETGDVHIALFGQISTGKSALIRALVPGASAISDVRGGTTQTLSRYQWLSRGGDRLVMTDMPGTASAEGQLDRVAIDEAQRAHIVVFVTDGDVNRAEHAALQALVELGKPLILVLNKTDRYSAAELAQLTTRLGELVSQHPHAELVSVSAGGNRDIVKILPDGSERTETRALAPRVAPLSAALQRLVDGKQEILEQLRDSATFVLANRHLDDAIVAGRRERADKLVDGYAVKAVLGALAAITPGSDLLIQGYLGTQLVKELAALYETKASKVDTELLLELVQRHAAKAHTLLLAVAGNALKAFPGIGTLAGGALHAIAYGIIFHTLGRALTTTLETRGELHPRQTARSFEEALGESMETSARDLARLVVEHTRDERSGADDRR